MGRLPIEGIQCAVCEDRGTGRGLPGPLAEMARGRAKGEATRNCDARDHDHGAQALAEGMGESLNMAKLRKKRGKYKPRTRPRPRTKYAKTLIREQRLASYLAQGMKHADACRLAGFPESVIKTGACQIVKRESVQKLLLQQNAELVEQGRRIDPQDLGHAAKARVQEGLTKLKANAREGKILLGYARTSMESAGMLGGPSELHLHNHQATLPPVVQQMLESKMREILEASLNPSENGITIREQEKPLICEIVQPIEAKPIEQPTVDTSAFEREQMERFTANYAKKHAMFPLKTA